MRRMQRFGKDTPMTFLSCIAIALIAAVLLVIKWKIFTCLIKLILGFVVVSVALYAFSLLF